MTAKSFFMQASETPRLIICFEEGTSMSEVCQYYQKIKEFLSPVISSPAGLEQSTITSKEVSRKFNIGESTFRMLVREGKMPKALTERGFRGCTLWSREAVETALLGAGYTRR